MRPGLAELYIQSEQFITFAGQRNENRALLTANAHTIHYAHQPTSEKVYQNLVS